MKDNLPNIWHQHDGRGMPVYLDRENFEVRFRDGATALNHRENWSWFYYPDQPCSGADVVAWRYIVGSMEVDNSATNADFGGIVKASVRHEIASTNFQPGEKGWSIDKQGSVKTMGEMEQRLTKYQKLIRGKDIDGRVASVVVDVYDVLTAWEVQNPALQHLIKKALQPGARGHKDLVSDLKDIIASAQRALELEQAKEVTK